MLLDISSAANVKLNDWEAASTVCMFQGYPIVYLKQQCDAVS
jgi:hypothetical protein